MFACIDTVKSRVIELSIHVEQMKNDHGYEQKAIKNGMNIHYGSKKRRTAEN